MNNYLVKIDKRQNIVQTLFGEYKDVTQLLSILDIQSPLQTLKHIPKQSNPILVTANTFQHGKIINSTKILVWNPIESLYVKEGKVYHNNTLVNHKFWEQLEIIIQKEKSKWIELMPHHEMLQYIGFYGYMSYELGRSLDPYPHREDVGTIPEAYFILPSDYIIYLKNTIYLMHLEGKRQFIPRFPSTNTAVEQSTHITTTPVEGYLQQMKKILEYIYAGEIYQINYTQQFIAYTNKQSRQIFFELQQLHQTPYSAYIEHQDFQILSLSPELFMKVWQGKVLTKPIKGTRKRGVTALDDAKLAEELLASEKDNAELSMIVDLLRNDLGKSSIPGSVHVEQHAVLESYSNVHHLVSTITSKINTKDTVKLILRAFPGGSISGVPKLRALEIIEEVETTPREIYTGSIGYFSITGAAEFNIAIRTILLRQNVAYFHAGGGIVADSKPIDEYVESLHKAKHIASYFGKTFMGNVSWINGKFVSTEHINVNDSIDGFFETVLIKNGELQRFHLHRERLQRGLEYYKLAEDLLPSIDDINNLLLLNLAETARLKITVSMEKTTTVLMQIFPYTTTMEPRTLLLKEQKVIDPKLLKQINAGLKPLNYKFYRELTKEAVELDYWDTIIVHNDMVTEGGRSNIYAKLQKQWYTPKINVVQGTIRSTLLLNKVIKQKHITLTELLMAEAICVSNALIGVQMVQYIYRDNRIIWKSELKDIDITLTGT